MWLAGLVGISRGFEVFKVVSWALEGFRGVHAFGGRKWCSGVLSGSEQFRVD